MALGLLDLSIVTDRLLKQLSDCATASRLWKEEPAHPDGTPSGYDPTAKFTVEYTGLPPDAARDLDECQVSLYLFHVAPDKFYRNTYPPGGTPPHIPGQPFALTLYYLLSVHSKASYIQEQQMMSVALKCFHDHPIVTATVALDNRVEEFTLTMEPQSTDEIGRLWLSLATPLRLSAVYRASVIFLEPETPRIAETKPVKAPEVRAYPQLIISRVDISNAGLAVVTGVGFSAETIVSVDGVALHTTTVAPPQSGCVYLADAQHIEIQLPSGTQKGDYLLRLRPKAGQPEALFTLHVAANVP